MWASFVLTYLFKSNHSAVVWRERDDWDLDGAAGWGGGCRRVGRKGEEVGGLEKLVTEGIGMSPKSGTDLLMSTFLQEHSSPAPGSTKTAPLTCTRISLRQFDSATGIHRCSISRDPTRLQICTEGLDGRTGLPRIRISDLLTQFLTLLPAELFLFGFSADQTSFWTC